MLLYKHQKNDARKGNCLLIGITVIGSSKGASLRNPHLDLSPQTNHVSRSRKHTQGHIFTSSMASVSSITGIETETKPFLVLFMCLGNIYRSPAGEGVFRDLLENKGFDSKFVIDSTGTINYLRFGSDI